MIYSRVFLRPREVETLEIAPGLVLDFKAPWNRVQAIRVFYPMSDGEIEIWPAEVNQNGLVRTLSAGYKGIPHSMEERLNHALETNGFAEVLQRSSKYDDFKNREII